MHTPTSDEAELKPANELTAIDLFCGAGGLTLGLKQAGFNVLAGVEMEDLPTKTFRANHPDVRCFQTDIRKLGIAVVKSSLGIKRGELDLLAGCPPCQGFSTLRTRRKAIAIDDHRNDLLFEFLRFVEGLLPKTIMMENVPALAKDQRIRSFLRKLSSLGYKIGRRTVTVEDAAKYGVPQRRFRMILLASRNATINRPNPKPSVTLRACLDNAQLALPGQSGDPLHDCQPKHALHVMEIIRHIPKDGGSRFSLPDRLVLACHKKNSGGFRDVYGRMAWDKVAPTMTGGCGNPSKGRYLHPSEDRAISLREAALIQTFPIDYHFPIELGRGKVALMIGNALPPEFIRQHATEISKALRGPIDVC